MTSAMEASWRTCEDVNASAGILELVTGVLITVGLFTRIAAFVVSGVMAFAFFTQHIPTGSIIPMVNNGEPAVLYCFAFFLLIFTGGGAIALDARSSATSRITQRKSVSDQDVRTPWSDQRALRDRDENSSTRSSLDVIVTSCDIFEGMATGDGRRQRSGRGSA